MRYFILAVAIATIAIYLLIGVLWLASQVAPMFALILIVVALGALIAFWEEKGLQSQWRKDMGYEDEE